VNQRLGHVAPAQAKKAIRKKKEQLFQRHRCSPIPTMLVPFLAQAPLFIIVSLVMRDACIAPSPLDMEAIFTLSSLSRPDSTGALPIIVGLLSLANVDCAKWFVGGEQARALLAKERARKQRDKEAGLIRISPQTAAKQLLRFFSVLRIVIGMVLPGAVIMYWTSSAAYSLVQSWIFDYWEAKHKERLCATPSLAAAVAETPEAPPRT